MAKKNNTWFEFHFKLTPYNTFLNGKQIDKFELFWKGFSYQEVLNEEKGITITKKQ